jgi:putative ABC transport system ATP-binding protein
MTEAIIEVSDVVRYYRQGDVEVRALRGASLQIHAGEFTCLAGPSGSGKTTLLNLLGCLDKPTSGRVKVAGHDVTQLSRGQAAAFRLKHIGFVFQAYNLVPVLTAYENAEFILLLQGVPEKERRQAVEKVLRAVGLENERDRKPHQLSGGQQQRVAVARAIASHPKIVLADEPTANLDSDTSASLLDLMCSLNRELGITFLLSSHDGQVMSRARRIIRMDSGCIVPEAAAHSSAA